MSIQMIMMLFKYFGIYKMWVTFLGHFFLPFNFINEIQINCNDAIFTHLLINMQKRVIFIFSKKLILV